MIDLPNLLLSYGVELRARGQEYVARCISGRHADNNPSMTVFLSKNSNWMTKCFSCGYDEGTAGVYCTLNGLNPKNKEHIAKALKALDDPTVTANGKKYARIVNDPHAIQEKRKPRAMLTPAADEPVPRMDYLKDKDTGESYGEPEAYWPFRNAVGIAEVYEARYIFKGRKEPRVFSYGRRGVARAKWECAHYEGPRPIFARDRIANCQQVAIFEGCRKAERAQELLDAAGASVVACTAWMGGANAWHKSDWSPIHSKPVLLFPDNDAPGHKAMHGLARELTSNACQVIMVLDDARPDGWDICDDDWSPESFVEWAKAHKKEWTDDKATEEQSGGKEDHSQQAQTIEDANHAPPCDDVPPPYTDPVPVESYINDDPVWIQEPSDLFSEFVVAQLPHGVLPKVIEDHVFDVAEIINTDPAFGAITAIATVAGLIDDRIKIQLNHGYRESARLWTVCVGEPSTKKSPIMDAIRAPLSAIKKRYSQEESKINQRQGILDARHKAKLKEYTEACIKSDDHDIPEPAPCEQLQRRRIECDNLTREAFEEVLRNMPSGLIIHADELAGWIGSMDAYKAAGAKADRALWLRAYNGGPMQVDRIGRGSYLIENWSATITGGIQPSKLASMAGQLDDDGLLQRFLIVSSSRQGGQGAGRAWDHSAAKAWGDLLEHVVEIKPGGGVVTLSDDAAAIRGEAVAYLYQIINANIVSRAFTTALGKWEGTTGRIMLIFHVIDCAQRGQHPESVPVSGETAQLAVDYMLKHLLPHMVSFYEDGLGQSPVSEVAKLIAGQIVANNLTEVKTTWLHKHGPGKWRNGTTGIQHDSLNRLIEYGWIAPAGGVNSATRRPTRYHVNPHVHDLFVRYREQEQKRIEAAREIGARIRAGGE